MLTCEKIKSYFINALISIFFFAFLPFLFIQIPSFILNQNFIFTPYPFILAALPFAFILPSKIYGVILFFILSCLTFGIEILRYFSLSYQTVVHMVVNGYPVSKSGPIIYENIKSLVPFFIILPSLSVFYFFGIKSTPLYNKFSFSPLLATIFILAIIVLNDNKTYKILPIERNLNFVEVHKPFINSAKIAFPFLFHKENDPAQIKRENVKRVPFNYDLYMKNENGPVLLIIVESLGLFRDTKVNYAQFSDLNLKDLEKKFEIHKGSLKHTGSTVSAEFREHCGFHISGILYQRESFTQKCLPEKFKHADFETYALHGYTGYFFSRNIVYPNLGFQNIFLQENSLEYPESNFQAKGGHSKGSISGLSDIRLLDHIFKNIYQENKKQFIYFLTLNAHLPAHYFAAGFDQNCEIWNLTESKSDNTRICKFQSYHSILFQQLYLNIKEYNYNHPIILVGDHEPRWYDKSIKKYYVTGRVPYVILLPKALSGKYILE